MSATATRPDQARTEFLRRLREGVEGGLDPLTAAERAVGSLPEALRRALEAMAGRVRGEYHED